MLVVGRRWDEIVSLAGSGVTGIAGRPIPLASSIETRGEGIGIAHWGVVKAARRHIPCGESRRCSAHDESRRECNLGLVQHCCISLSRIRPAPLGDRRVARRHPLNFRLRKTILEFSASYSSGRAGPIACGLPVAARQADRAGSRGFHIPSAARNGAPCPAFATTEPATRATIPEPERETPNLGRVAIHADPLAIRIVGAVLSVR
jgi:hypothetical protein